MDKSSFRTRSANREALLSIRKIFVELLQKVEKLHEDLQESCHQWQTEFHGSLLVSMEGAEVRSIPLTSKDDSPAAFSTQPIGVVACMAGTDSVRKSAARTFPASTTDKEEQLVKFEVGASDALVLSSASREMTWKAGDGSAKSGEEVGVAVEWPITSWTAQREPQRPTGQQWRHNNHLDHEILSIGEVSQEDITSVWLLFRKMPEWDPGGSMSLTQRVGVQARYIWDPDGWTMLPKCTDMLARDTWDPGGPSLAKTACMGGWRVGSSENVISFGSFLSPMPTFYRIWKRGAVESFSPLPYLAAVMNDMLWIFYGLPFVHLDSTLVITIDALGLFLEIVYLTIFFIYATKKEKLYVLKFLAGEVVLMILIASLLLSLELDAQELFDKTLESDWVGGGARTLVREAWDPGGSQAIFSAYSVVSCQRVWERLG